MQLPGGLVRQGQRLRGFEFRALTGALELQLAETSAGALPQQVQDQRNSDREGAEQKRR